MAYTRMIFSIEVMLSSRGHKLASIAYPANIENAVWSVGDGRYLGCSQVKKGNSPSNTTTAFTSDVNWKNKMKAK